MPEVGTGVISQQCSKGLPFTFTKCLRVHPNHLNLLSLRKPLLLCFIIYTLELPVGPFRIALTWHSSTELLTEECESESDLQNPVVCKRN